MTHSKLNKKVISIGHVKIGHRKKVAIQSMAKKNPHDFLGLLKQTKEIEKQGCDIFRIAVPDEESIEVFKKVKKSVSIPLVADIHFDWRLAIKSIDAGADKIRINPSNLGGEENLKKVVRKAKKANIPIRIGVNAGSIKSKTISPEILANLALENAQIIENLGFDKIVISIKSSSIEQTIETNELLAKKTPYPLHLGLTEAGPLISGTVKSSAALIPLLKKGIGDTIRISLTSSPETEIKVAKDILAASGIEKSSVNIISCPTCGRTKNNIEKIAFEIEKKLSSAKKPLKIAIMGCEVNGPGEVMHSDLGIIGGKKMSIFIKGKFFGTFEEKDLLNNFLKILEKEAF